MTNGQKAHTGNMGLFIIMTVIYIGLLILFAWQTWQFVDWLFPGDQLLMKLLTVLCFDIMALLWACLDLFYTFAIRGARTLVRWAWAISFFLSLLASIFYLVIKSMFRFQVALDQASVNVGYGVVITAVTLQVLFATFWLYLEWNARHPHNDDYAPEDYAPTPVVVSQVAHVPQIAASSPTQSDSDKKLADLLQQIESLRDENAKLAAKPAPVAHHIDPAQPKPDPQPAPLNQANQSSQKKPKALPKMTK